MESEKKDGGLGGSIEFPLLADLNKKVASEYGVLADAGIALRGLFLINPEGAIMHSTINFLPVGRSTDEALRVLKAFQFVASNKGKVCPLDWNEDKLPMEASPEGMRKYLTQN